MNLLTSAIKDAKPLATLFVATLSVCVFAEEINLQDPDFWRRTEENCYQNQIKSSKNSSTPKETLRSYCLCTTKELKKYSTQLTWSNKATFNVVAENAARECISLMHPQEKQSIDSQLIALSNDLNKNLPTTLDKHTRQDSTFAGPGRRMTYLYTLTQLRASDIDPQTLKEAFRPNIINSYCTDPSVYFYRENRVELTYKYRDFNGKHMTQIDVSPNDCVR